MGTTTPNIGLFIPADGETNYGTAFANGMLNLDTHDHSGAPSKGVPLSATGLANGSVTALKLNANVLSPSGGLTFDVNNAIQTDLLLKAINGIGSNGLIARTSGSTAAARTLVSNTPSVISITSANGVAGNPTFEVPTTFYNEGDYTPAVSSSGVAITGLVISEATGRWQRIGNWLMVDASVIISGTGGPAGELRITAPFAAVGSNYYLSGLWIDQVPTQTTSANEIASGTSYFRIFVPGIIGTDQVPGAGAWIRNIQFTGIYRVA